jgi:hypothetical protein
MPKVKKSMKRYRAAWMEKHCPDLDGMDEAERESAEKFHMLKRKDGRMSKSCLCAAYIVDERTGRQRKCRRRALTNSIFCSTHKTKGHRVASKNAPIYNRRSKGHDPRMDLTGFVGSNFYGCGCDY